MALLYKEDDHTYKDKRRKKVQTGDTHWNQKMHIPLVSL